MKQAVLSCQSEDHAFAQSIAASYQQVVQADQFWWRSHGQAMRRMVCKPVSLARMDAQEKATEAGEQVDFEAYREKVLREPQALLEYDSYFAVERRADTNLQDWRQNLNRVLAVADDYISPVGPIAYRWRSARPHLYQLMQRAAH